MPTTKPAAPGTSEAPVRKRRGFPVVPTMMVALALPILVGLGIWQISRMHWKDQLLADMQRNANAPRLAITGPIPADANFRAVELQLDCSAQPPSYEAARNLKGANGWATILACKGPGGESVQLLEGWSERPDAWAKMATQPAAGVRHIRGWTMRGVKAAWRVYPDSAPPPFQPVQPPSPDELPNNHFSYAIQWFSFAAILLVIYGLWLRRWLAARRDAD